MYPALSVAPLNLVPACQDCNKIRGELSPENIFETTLHPYFDDIEQSRWLQAKVIESSPTALLYSVNAPTNWNNVLSTRVEFHFSKLKLAQLYSSHAGVELGNIRYILNKLFKEGGQAAVQKYLRVAIATYKSANENSWQTAMYVALAQNNWFTSGGFKT